MTYNIRIFLMHEDGSEYGQTFKAGAAAPYSGIYYCEACIALTRQHRVRSGGAWR
jgi:hypothetical protein